MSLRDQLQNQQPLAKGPRCSICKLLQTLPEDDQMALLEALESSLHSTFIQRAIMAEGHKIGRGSVARHRRGDCAGL